MKTIIVSPRKIGNKTLLVGALTSFAVRVTTEENKVAKSRTRDDVD